MTEARGLRTIYGRLKGINEHQDGATATVQVYNARYLTVVSMTIAEAQQLATKLFSTVRVRGDAVWRLGDRAPRTMQLTSIEPFEDVPIDEAFRQLADAADGAWDDVDVAAYMKRVRG